MPIHHSLAYVHIDFIFKMFRNITIYRPLSNPFATTILLPLLVADAACCAALMLLAASADQRSPPAACAARLTKQFARAEGGRRKRRRMLTFFWREDTLHCMCTFHVDVDEAGHVCTACWYRLVVVPASSCPCGRCRRRHLVSDISDTTTHTDTQHSIQNEHSTHTQKKKNEPEMGLWRSLDGWVLMYARYL